MKDIRLKMTFVLASIVVFFVLMGIGGNIDYTEYVIQRMDYDEYNGIKQLLTDSNGKAPSDSEIVHWWTEHHDR